jgi:hypothetical protein
MVGICQKEPVMQCFDWGTRWTERWFNTRPPKSPNRRRLLKRFVPVRHFGVETAL